MIDGFPFSFFLPLVVHALAGLVTGFTGLVAFCAPKSQERHHWWGICYLWAYTLVFLTVTLLSEERWAADGYLFFLALIGYGFVLFGYGAQRFRYELFVKRIVGKQWVVVHIAGMIASYVILWTAFFVDNAHLIPLLNQLPLLTFWVLPSLLSLPFLVLSLSRFVPKYATPSQRSQVERKGMI